MINHVRITMKLLHQTYIFLFDDAGRDLCIIQSTNEIINDVDGVLHIQYYIYLYIEYIYFKFYCDNSQSY